MGVEKTASGLPAGKADCGVDLVATIGGDAVSAGLPAGKADCGGAALATEATEGIHFFGTVGSG
jgi:hypothetical protein